MSRAANQFKKPITDRINHFDNVFAYKALYESYEKVLDEGDSK